jgi:hypothetical protein
MSAGNEDRIVRMLGVRNLAIDRLAAEIAAAFDREGIESLVLKGPVLAAWLYPGELRPYGDADLMVAPGNWDRAVAILGRLGFADHLGPLGHPRMESFASTAFLRGEDNLDLHCTVHGLDGDPERIWGAFLGGSAREEIGGAELRVPGEAALALHAALHAAHHVEGKPLEDLRRAIARADEETWREALELAHRLDGVPTFASGMRLLPQGAELLLELGVGEEVRSTRHEIRFEGVATAEGIDALLQPGLGPGRRLGIVLGELFPRPEFMRWWSPLARRGQLGLLLSYPWRWLYLAIKGPSGLRTVLRARRGRSR